MTDRFRLTEKPKTEPIGLSVLRIFFVSSFIISENPTKIQAYLVMPDPTSQL